jgi:tRNA threonylcarbamoyladenosine biosynthesis protein TsaB
VLAQLSLNHGQTHSRFVFEAIDGVLELSQVALDEIDAFGVTRGPGSFTGLRIGISAVKGLAFATGKPMLGISTLDALAHQVQGDGPLVCALMDARRDEIYWRVYRYEDGIPRPQTAEQVGPVDRLFDRIAESCLFVGSGAVLYADRLAQGVKPACRWAPAICHVIHPATVGRLAWKRYQQGRWDDALTLKPVYLRKSDAELNLKEQD